MTHEPGPLIASGRAADVYAYRDGLVLRRYRTDYDCTYEADVMRHVRAHGYPVPDVVDASGRDLVMERLDGTTMLNDFGRHPWLLFRHAATLADLMHRLHALPVPDGLVRKHPTGDVIVHLDLHPDNVMLTSRGPVVIDWSNAGVGDAGAEVADLWLVMSSATVPGRGVMTKLMSTGRGLLIRSFLKHFDLSTVTSKLSLAYDLRSHDRNMSESEKERMRALVERRGT